VVKRPEIEIKKFSMHALRNQVGLWIVLSVISIVLTYDRQGYAEEFRYGFGVSPSYYTGDYGTSNDVDIFYLPFIFKFYPSDRIRGAISVPWIYQSSTQVISAGGMFHGIEGMNNVHNRDASLRFRMTGRDVEEVRDSASGLGDIVVRGEYDLLLESLNTFDLTLEGLVKLPTARESEGLGTGEVDVGIAAELGRTINSIYCYGRLGYTAVGEHSGADFDNPFLYEVGAGFDVTPRVYLNLFLAGNTSIDDEIDDPLVTVLSGEYRLRRGLSLNSYFLVGLSDGSPDFGVGAGLLQKI